MRFSQLLGDESCPSELDYGKGEKHKDLSLTSLTSSGKWKPFLRIKIKAKQNKNINKIINWKSFNIVRKSINVH